MAKRTTNQATGSARGHGNETALTGDTLMSASDAALAANAGAKVVAATTEDPAENTGAAYEVHAHTSTKQVTVLLDKDFKVVKTEMRTVATTADRHERERRASGAPSAAAQEAPRESSAALKPPVSRHAGARCIEKGALSARDRRR